MKGGARALGALEFAAARMLAEIRRVVKNPADVEAIHRARVAARRFLAAGDVWAGGVEGWRAFAERVSRLIRRLGRVRNLDVSLGLLARGPVSERPARVEFARILRRRRKKEEARLADWLTLKRVAKVEQRLAKIRTALSVSPPSPAPGPASLQPYFERLSRLAELMGSEGDVESGHEARRELRRLRYAHEMISAPVGSAAFTGDSERFRAVQQVAGAWHDLCILEELAVKVERKGRSSASLEPFLERIRGEAQGRLDEFVIALGELQGLRLRLTGEAPE